MEPVPRSERIEQLFHAVVDLPDEEAALVLNQECPREDALRHEVERLRRLDRGAAPNFLSPNRQLIAEVVAAAERGGDESLLEEVLRCADRVGRFVVLKRLDQGAMGIVYAAYDESLDRRVALKVLRRGLALPEYLAREGRALARLTHPNVVQIHEIGEHDGRPFIAMELVAGRSLAAWLAERPRPADEIVRTFVQAGRGLSAAHEAGLVHRDFKPDNVLVGTDGRVRVVDFGIAASADPTPAVEAAPPGTPAYMAPELFAGERASAASDQFGFCVALYRALFGIAPFSGNDVLTLQANVLAGKLCTAPTSAEVPAWMTGILTRGLARQPADRFTTMSQLLDAIEGHLPAHPELDPTVGRRERRLVAKVMVLLGSAALVGLALVRSLSHTEPGVAEFVAAPAAAFVLQSVVALAFRGRLLGNRFARKMVLVVWIQIATLLLHRSFAILAEQPLSQVLPIDLLVLGMEQLIAMVLFERWFGVNAAVFLAGALVAVLWPASAATAMLASVTVAYLVAATRIGL